MDFDPGLQNRGKKDLIGVCYIAATYSLRAPVASLALPTVIRQPYIQPTGSNPESATMTRVVRQFRSI